MTQIIRQVDGRVKEKTLKGKYERHCAEVIAASGGRFLKINWHKNQIHFINSKNNKQVTPVWSIL